MRAIKIVSPGGIEALEIGEFNQPEAVGDRVLVRVRAAALNRADLLQRRGHYPAPPDAPQDIPGLEFAGEVEQVGSEVRAWRVGQRVFGITGGGAQAEFVVVPESALAEIPKNLDWVEAAAVPEAFITAHDALFTQARFEIGESVRVHQGRVDGQRGGNRHPGCWGRVNNREIQRSAGIGGHGLEGRVHRGRYDQSSAHHRRELGWRRFARGASVGVLAAKRRGEY